ncbi:LOW QUALITY PROTEIN: reverse transcriptase [Phytophthora megakarya]|uniref:Reverse transcriptase n=1 Tax=Phytophthora megakarya TaxID=4795 RepID=A0A225UM83_9STRA|nr:LOW QUALITY PROTEIN: reverse transcriptase [Phytophthora megakarya]
MSIKLDSTLQHETIPHERICYRLCLMEFDDEGRERVVSYQSRQMKPADNNYLVDTKETLAMRYALIKFRVYLLGEQTFDVYTDYASLRTAMRSPHLLQRTARWLSFSAEYNFIVHYKPDKNNILLTCCLAARATAHAVLLVALDVDDEDDCACCIALGLNATVSTPVSPLRQQIAEAYDVDAFYADIITHLQDPSVHSLKKMTRPTRDHIASYQTDGPLV